MLRKASAAATFVLVLSGIPQMASAQNPQASVEEKKDAPDNSILGRMKGSSVSVQHSMNLSTLDKNWDLTWNPTVLQTFEVNPRYRVTDKISVSLSASLETELTNSDDTPKQRQPLFKDMAISGSYKIPELPYGLQPAASLKLAIPTSQESLARDRILGPGAATGLARTFKLAKDIALTPALALGGSYWFATSQSANYDGSTITTCLNCSEFMYSGARAGRATLSQALAVEAELPFNLSANVSMAWLEVNKFPLSEAYDDQGNLIPISENNVNWNYFMIYGLGVAWKAHKYVGVEAGFQALVPQLEPDSESGYAPFFNRYTEGYLKVVGTL